MGAYLLEVGVCLGQVPANLGRVVCCIGKSGLRLGEGGFKLVPFGHDLCRNAVRPCDCVYDLSGARAEILS